MTRHSTNETKTGTDHTSKPPCANNGSAGNTGTTGTTGNTAKAPSRPSFFLRRTSLPGGIPGSPSTTSGPHAGPFPLRSSLSTSSSAHIARQQPAANSRRPRASSAPPAPLIWINGFPGVGKLTIAQWLHRLLDMDRSLLLDNHNQHSQSTAPHHQRSSSNSHHNLFAPAAPNSPNTTRASLARHAPSLPPTPEHEVPDPFASPAHGGGASSKPSLAEVLAAPVNIPRTVIVTACAIRDSPPYEGAVAAAKECEEAAARTGRVFVPVYLACQEEENMRRVGSAERRCSTSSGSGSRSGSVSSSASASASAGNGAGAGPGPTLPPCARMGPDPGVRINSPGLARCVRVGRSLFVFEGREGLELDVTDLEAHEAAMEILSFVNARVDECRMRSREEAGG